MTIKLICKRIKSAWNINCQSYTYGEFPFLLRPHDCSRSQLAASSLLLLSWFSFATTRSPPTIDEYRPTAF